MKKKSILKLKVQTPTGLEDFQAQYGEDWMRLTQTPVFQAAILLLRERKLASIVNLRDEDIEKNGREALSDLRGHLQMESDLANLHDKKEFKFPLEEPEEYLAPEAAAEVEQMLAKYRDQQRKLRYG